MKSRIEHTGELLTGTQKVAQVSKDLNRYYHAIYFDGVSLIDLAIAENSRLRRRLSQLKVIPTDLLHLPDELHQAIIRTLKKQLNNLTSDPKLQALILFSLTQGVMPILVAFHYGRKSRPVNGNACHFNLRKTNTGIRIGLRQYFTEIAEEINFHGLCHAVAELTTTEADKFKPMTDLHALGLFDGDKIIRDSLISREHTLESFSKSNKGLPQLTFLSGKVVEHPYKKFDKQIAQTWSKIWERKISKYKSTQEGALHAVMALFTQYQTSWKANFFVYHHTSQANKLTWALDRIRRNRSLNPHEKLAQVTSHLKQELDNAILTGANLEGSYVGRLTYALAESGKALDTQHQASPSLG